MNDNVLHLIERLKNIEDRFRNNEKIWYELRDAEEIPRKNGDPPKNGRRDRITYDHIRETLNIELLILQIEVELLKMGKTPKDVLSSLKEKARREEE